MSKEHAWPQWMKATARVLPTRTHTSIGFSRTAEDTLTEAPNVTRERQGSVLTVQVREVCRLCNNGWMSALEIQARPVLEPLWSGEKTRLTSAEVVVVTRWAVKTAWMHERSQHEVPTPTADQRRAVLDGRLPALTRVWAARHLGEIDFWSPVATVSTGHRDDAWDAPQKRQVMIAMLVCHGVALLVRTDDGTGVPALRMDTALWTPLWPRAGRGRLAWPRRTAAGDDDLRARMLDHTDWVQVPDVPRFERDTRGWLDRPPSPYQAGRLNPGSAPRRTAAMRSTGSARPQ
jgi:hypothetical protein